MDPPKENVKCVFILKAGVRKDQPCDRICTISNKCPAHISKREHDEYLNRCKIAKNDTTG